MAGKHRRGIGGRTGGVRSRRGKRWTAEVGGVPSPERRERVIHLAAFGPRKQIHRARRRTGRGRTGRIAIDGRSQSGGDARAAIVSVVLRGIDMAADVDGNRARVVDRTAAATALVANFGGRRTTTSPP